ncbi:MAG: hypothetical protein CMC14_00695 [Flavobacteriaceae bacterium]|nr:hypothetical protein [Flavobacteriaceae bacterium]
MILTACEQNQKKKNLIGVWETIENSGSKINLIVYQDSLIIKGFDGGTRMTSEWSVDDSNIYLKNFKENNSLLYKEMIYEYELNDSHDQILIKIPIGEDYSYKIMNKKASL